MKYRKVKLLFKSALFLNEIKKWFNDSYNINITSEQAVCFALETTVLPKVTRENLTKRAPPINAPGVAIRLNARAYSRLSELSSEIYGAAGYSDDIILSALITQRALTLPIKKAQ